LQFAVIVRTDVALAVFTFHHAFIHL
jgi:hypothetical protein